MNTTPDSWHGEAIFRTVRATRPVAHIDSLDDAATLANEGFWVVVARFEGGFDAWRMDTVEYRDETHGSLGDGAAWHGPHPDSWATSLDEAQYIAGVNNVRAHIREGDVYQVNLCRILHAPFHAPKPGAASALRRYLQEGNPSRYAASIDISASGSPERACAWVVSASPELYLSVDGATVNSSPIKGTAAPGADMLPKDEAENVMITDLVRNDLSHVAKPGSVAVTEFLGLHHLPGLQHLQSTVSVELTDELSWAPRMWQALFDGTFPPGSVSGAPKSSALRIIQREEREDRGPYCGAIGWIDADRRRAELAVGIRTFWWEPDHGGTLRFGTGAGITWGSDAQAEWEETELKASRLIALASAGTMTP
ncbi:chorismate-binding protein [Demequina sediminicola]|uniref:chorismate-binding protein n=1 Tax=Demequina sediminicola TaxID=1095026 RepID=UPI000782B441|nr:chorismate-binding protein [Demequina sediminicola]